MKASTTKTNKPAIDLTKLLAPYTSGWVALSSDKTHVVGSGSTLEEAHEQAIEHYAAGAVFVKVIPPEEGYASRAL
jgi:hypothetical protein